MIKDYSALLGTVAGILLIIGLIIAMRQAERLRKLEEKVYN